MLQPSRNPRPTPPKSLRPFLVLLPPQAQSQWYHPRRQKRMRRVTRMRSRSGITLPFVGSTHLFYPLSRKLWSPILSSTLRTSWNNTKSIVFRCNKTMTVNLLTRRRRALRVHQASPLFLLLHFPYLSLLHPRPPRCRHLHQASQALGLLLRLQLVSHPALQRLQPVHLLSAIHHPHPHLLTLNLCRRPRPRRFLASLARQLHPPCSNQLPLKHQRRSSLLLQ